VDKNPYAKQTNYELANPSIFESRSNEKIPLSEQYQDQDDKVQDCLVRISKIIGNQKQVWDRIFSEDAREYIFRNTAECTFQPIIRVVESKLGQTWSVTDVKNRLLQAYSKLIQRDPDNLDKVLKIMREQGKSKMFTKSKMDMSFELLQDVIISNEYYLCDMDIWALANEYELPIVVFNANGLKGFFAKTTDTETSNVNTQWIKMGGSKDDRYHFIRSKIRVAKGSYANHIYEYNLIVPNVKLSQTREFEEMVVESVRADRLNTMRLEDALERFF
jgi:hypothetical protein